MRQTTKCRDADHDYRPASTPYLKRSGEKTGGGTPKDDELVSFLMIYCANCGDTKEIIAADHRRKEEGNADKSDS